MYVKVFDAEDQSSYRANAPANNDNLDSAAGTLGMMNMNTMMAPWSVKSGGDFADILALENPNVWESHRPAKGGDAGKMFADIIAKATQIKLAQEKPAKRLVKKKKAAKKAAARK